MTALSKSAEERVEKVRVNERYVTLRTLIRAAAGFGVAVFGFQALEKFAGQDTSVALNAAFSVVADLRVVLAVSLAGVATVWALIERRLRQRKTDNLQGRIRDLETKLDIKRTTSGLTTKGQTNPRDKPR